MAKYSFEFKMEVVQAYLNAEGGYRYLASKYNIPAKRRIEEWVHAYREFGEEGLMRSRQNKKYTFQFKLSWVVFPITVCHYPSCIRKLLMQKRIFLSYI